jgi:hypothetical protein
MASALNCTYKVAQLFRHLHVKAKKLQTQIDKQAEQINFLTDLLRSQQIHEPRCTTYQGQCNCWLSVDISDTTL